MSWLYTSIVVFAIWLIAPACLYIGIRWALRIINRWAQRDMDRYLDVGGYEPIARREP